MAPTVADIQTALKKCLDPELGINIIDLGLVYDIAITPRKVTIVMTLTTPGCPLLPYFQQDIEQRVKTASGTKQVDITLTFDPPWTPQRMSEAGRQQLTLVR